MKQDPSLQEELRAGVQGAHAHYDYVSHKYVLAALLEIKLRGTDMVGLPHGGLRDFHPGVNLLRSIIVKALFGTRLVTLPPEIGGMKPSQSTE